MPSTSSQMKCRFKKKSFKLPKSLIEVNGWQKKKTAEINWKQIIIIRRTEYRRWKIKFVVHACTALGE